MCFPLPLPWHHCGRPSCSPDLQHGKECRSPGVQSCVAPERASPLKQFASTSHYSLGSQRSHCRHLLVLLAEVLGSMCLSSSSQSDGPAAPRCFIPVWACVVQVSVDSHTRSAEAATFLETLLFGAVSTPGCSLGRRARCNAQRCHCSPCMSTLVFRSSDAVEDQQHEAL